MPLLVQLQTGQERPQKIAHAVSGPERRQITPRALVGEASTAGTQGRTQRGPGRRCLPGHQDCSTGGRDRRGRREDTSGALCRVGGSRRRSQRRGRERVRRERWGGAPRLVGIFLLIPDRGSRGGAVGGGTGSGGGRWSR